MVTSYDLLASLYGYSNTTPTPSTPVGRVQAGGWSTRRIAYGTHCAHIGLVPPVGGAACCYGGYSVGETPGPIPNPEAKTHSADGTAPGRVWESRTPPDPFYWWPPGPPPSRGGAWRPPPFNPPLLSLL